MVILEEGKRRKRPLSIHYTTYNKPSTENGQDEETDSATRSAASNSAISAATLAVLPRLFRHTSGFLKWTSGKSKGKSYSQRNSEEMYDELSWINKIGAFFWHSRKSEQRKPFAVTVTPGQMKDFFCLLEHDRIKQFLDEQDQCKVYADSYLLAMVFTYFLRAKFTSAEYNPDNFFIALVLAHDIEEENFKIEVVIANWEAESIGSKGDEAFVPMSTLRYELFRRINYRALVSRKCCEEIMSMYPEHWAWRRKRAEHHAGVDQERRYPLDCMQFVSWIPWGPDLQPRDPLCFPCKKLQQAIQEAQIKKQIKKANGRLSLKRQTYSHSPVLGVKKEKLSCEPDWISIPFKIKEEFLG